MKQSIYENPSAGKFDPPPPPPEPGDDRHRGRWLAAGLVIVSSYPVSHFLISFSYRGRGWLSLLAPLAGVALVVVHHALQRQRADERSDDVPYSKPTSLTR